MHIKQNILLPNLHALYAKWLNIFVYLNAFSASANDNQFHPVFDELLTGHIFLTVVRWRHSVLHYNGLDWRNVTQNCWLVTVARSRDWRATQHENV